MNSLFLAICLIFIFIAWKLILKKAIIEWFKDDILFLKDDIDVFYEENSISFDDHTYKALNDLIDSYLRTIDSISIIDVGIIATQLKNNNKVVYVNNKIEQRFKTNNSQIKGFSDVIRIRANSIAISCLLLSNPIILIIGIFTVIRVVFRLAFDSPSKIGIKIAYELTTKNLSSYFEKECLNFAR